MAILDLCEEYFATRDVYKLFEISKDAPNKDIKKAYYKISLQVHPDRVDEKEKEVATEKFKVLSKLYQVLIDKDKRAIYDEHGTIDEDDDMDGKINSWLDLWRKIFKPLTVEDISNYEKSYIDSDLERNDIKKAYLAGKGCINYMMNEVPFLRVEDEPRLQKIVGEMISSEEVPEYKIFTNEPAQKRSRRHKKYARESREADEIKQKLLAKGNLEQQLMSRQRERSANFDSFMDDLLKKYGNEEDESDVIDFSKASGRKKTATPKKKAPKKSLNAVKNGKVKKQKK